MDLMSRRGLLAQMAGKGLELIGRFTVPESWENDTKGNAKVVYDDYIIPMVQQLDDYTPVFIKAVGNTAANYRFIYAFLYKGIEPGAPSPNFVSLRLIPSSGVYQIRSGGSTSVSIWFSNGTIVEVYKVMV